MRRRSGAPSQSSVWSGPDRTTTAWWRCLLARLTDCVRVVPAVFEDGGEGPGLLSDRTNVVQQPVSAGLLEVKMHFLGTVDVLELGCHDLAIWVFLHRQSGDLDVVELPILGVGPEFEIDRAHLLP